MYFLGYCDKALPPDGPKDNVYEKSKHSHKRLSEKRLMQWKVHERQLEKFLMQFENRRPHTSPGERKRYVGNIIIIVLLNN